MTSVLLRIVMKRWSSIGGRRKLEKARRAFEWIATAQRPLMLDELCEAVAIDKGDPSLDFSKVPTDGLQLLDACGSLISFDSASTTVTFAHRIVLQFLTLAGFSTDYLTSEEQQALQTVALDQSQVELEIAERCITYLTFTDFERQLVRQSKIKFPVNAQALSSVLWSNRPHEASGRALARLRGARFKSATGTVNLTRAAGTDKDLHGKYRLLSYVFAEWASHLKHVRGCDQLDDDMLQKLERMAFRYNYAFDTRPWAQFQKAERLDDLHSAAIWSAEHDNATLIELAYLHALHSFRNHHWNESPILDTAFRNDSTAVVEYFLRRSGGFDPTDQLSSVLQNYFTVRKSEAPLGISTSSLEFALQRGLPYLASAIIESPALSSIYEPDQRGSTILSIVCTSTKSTWPVVESLVLRELFGDRSETFLQSLKRLDLTRFYSSSAPSDEVLTVASGRVHGALTQMHIKEDTEMFELIKHNVEAITLHPSLLNFVSEEDFQVAEKLIYVLAEACGLGHFGSAKFYQSWTLIDHAISYSQSSRTHDPERCGCYTGFIPGPTPTRPCYIVQDQPFVCFLAAHNEIGALKLLADRDLRTTKVSLRSWGDLRDKEGRTALGLAAGHGHVETLRFLLDSEARWAIFKWGSWQLQLAKSGVGSMAVTTKQSKSECDRMLRRAIANYERDSRSFTEALPLSDPLPQLPVHREIQSLPDPSPLSALHREIQLQRDKDIRSS